ncbi:MAG: NfeD family protein [Caldilineae bacterium]|nr:MAG: NfeD family protein [Caldilineae bacterium]
MFEENLGPLLTWAWIVIGILFFIAEIFTAGFVLLCFGIGALAAAAVAYFGLGLTWQLVVFIVVSAAAVVLSRPFAERVSAKGHQGVAGDRMLGKQAVVLKEINPIANTGMVRMETEEWRAESVNGAVIPAGELVEVIGVDGVRLQVRPVRDGLKVHHEGTDSTEGNPQSPNL